MSRLHVNPRSVSFRRRVGGGTGALRGMQPVTCNVWIGAIGAAAMLLTAGWARAAETPFERGSYLVNVMGACGRCHTPRDAQGRPIAAMALAGGFEFDDGG